MPRTTLAATALSLVAALAACTNSDPQQPTEPAATDQQTTSAPSPAAPTSTSTRPLTYTDDYAGNPNPPHWRMRTIQYGDRVLRPGLDVTAIDITDDGLALIAVRPPLGGGSEDANGEIYFTDGSSTEKIGELTIEHGRTYLDSGVKTSTSGSLVAWFKPSGPDRSLVVYDTHEHRVLADVPIPACAADGVTGDCYVAAVVGDRVYWWPNLGARRLMVLDVPTATVSKTDARALSEDLRSHPRGFVKGDNYDTDEVVNQDINGQRPARQEGLVGGEAVFFVPQGSTLELSRVVGKTGAKTDCDGEDDGTVAYCYGGFDTTGRRLNLQLPTGYTPAENPYVLFQWLDDDRFAVMAGATHDFGLSGWSGYGDILVCDIAHERCTLAVPGPDGGPTSDSSWDGFRLVPHLTLPN